MKNKFLTVLIFCLLLFSSFSCFAVGIDINIKTNEQTVSSGVLTPNDFEYLGSFRVPDGMHGDSRFGYSTGRVAYNPKNNTLYLSGHDYEQMIAEITIPPLTIGAVEDMGIAHVVTNFFDPSDQLGKQIVPNRKLGGLHVFNDTLYWSFWEYYNVSNDDPPVLGFSNNDPSQLSATGMYRIGNFNVQKTGGYIVEIPKDFADQHLNGWRLAVGHNGGIPGLASTSLGPALIAIDHTLPSARTSAQLLMQYPYLGSSDGGDVINHQACDRYHAVSWISYNGRSVVMFAGSKSLGETYYGPGREGDCSASKGYHCSPYTSRFLFYNPEDFVKVINGQNEPNIAPIASVDDLGGIIKTCRGLITDMTFDQQRGLLYVVQDKADTISNQYEALPVIHVYKIK